MIVVSVALRLIGCMRAAALSYGILEELSR
jgi:hypothetical protein